MIAQIGVGKMLYDGRIHGKHKTVQYAVKEVAQQIRINLVILTIVQAPGQNNMYIDMK